ncbi:hypothetical protein [Streptomyces sp. NBC_01353]|uniref:hypothetical protein n=1 Tax=Streptomyces sp. NBC_01353 TaxID=2903835 RepID=UPI002E314FCD|nr:hypothetical protein [Streptomyces sp. NBC_01353]
MTTRTRAKNPTSKKSTRRKTTTAVPAAPAAPAPISPKLPTLDVRNRRPFMTDLQIRAAFAASLAGVTCTRITGWLHQDDDTVRYALPSGAGLTYNPAAKTPLTAWTPCAHGVRHAHPIAERADLLQAQMDAAACTSPHNSAPAVRTLADALTRSDTSSADTQSLNVTQLRAAHDEPQEHPGD